MRQSYLPHLLCFYLKIFCFSTYFAFFLVTLMLLYAKARATERELIGMLGIRIASLRKEAGMSQAALAKRLGITASAVGMYEQGRREPPCDILIAISREFRVSIDYLLTGREASQTVVKTLASVFPGLEKMSLEEMVVLLLARTMGSENSPF